MGHPLPGVAAQVVDPATFAPLPPNQRRAAAGEGIEPHAGLSGRARAHGRGAARRLVHHRRYRARSTTKASSASPTGCRASARSRGEMVPHLRIEEALAAVLGDAPCAVTGGAGRAARRAAGGAVCSTRWRRRELWQRLTETDLPRLWIPKRENIYRGRSAAAAGHGQAGSARIESAGGGAGGGAGRSPRRHGGRGEARGGRQERKTRSERRARGWGSHRGYRDWGGWGLDAETRRRRETRGGRQEVRGEGAAGVLIRGYRDWRGRGLDAEARRRRETRGGRQGVRGEGAAGVLTAATGIGVDGVSTRRRGDAEKRAEEGKG